LKIRQRKTPVGERNVMNRIYASIVAGFLLGIALAIPLDFWLCLAAALIFAAGLWAIWHVVKGMAKAYWSEKR
jgi:hypothetical protein